MIDAFGDRMKKYEKLAQQCFMPLLPICIRLDGRSFSKWTRCMSKPYDERMMEAMKNTTIKLVEETNAVMGYTQSDEISLILYSDDIDSQVYFGGKIQKIVSSTAAKVTTIFNEEIGSIYTGALNAATFDSRAWQVPNKAEAVNVLLWREQDATKNSISMAARSVYSHKQLMNKNGKEMQDMLVEKGINWNDYPDQFKRGVFVQKVKEYRKFTAEELKNLPEKHEARVNPNLKISRTAIQAVDVPPFSKVVNRKEFVFLGQPPVKLV